MPVIFREAGYRVFFYSDEGDPREPLHVHVRKGGAEAKLWLRPELTVERSYGFNAKELSAILGIVQQHEDEIERAWHEHFGD